MVAISKKLVRYSALLIVTAGLIGCGDGEGQGRAPDAAGAEEVTGGGIAVGCFQAAPESLNPFASPSQSAVDLLPVLYTPLVRYGEGDSFAPNLAEEWHWEEGNRVLVFRIRNDLSWHDGVPVTADDVVWTVRAAANPEYAYWNSGDFSTLEEVRATDSVTVQLTYTDPPFADLEPFVSLPILPAHLLAEVPASQFAQAPYQRSPVGSGPFRFTDRNPDGSITFSRVEGFPEDLGRPLLDRLVVRPIPEATALATELQSAAVDVCVTTAVLAERFRGSERVDLLSLSPVGIQVIVLNTAHPPLDDSRVRRALSAALQRDRLGAVWSPMAERAHNLLPPTSPWFDASLSQPDNDSALAASLLDEAGWSRADGDAVRRNAAGDELSLLFLGPPQYEPILTAAQAQLRRLGVDVEARFMEFSSYVQTILDPESRPDLMALGLTQEKLLYPDFYEDLHSGGSRNVSSYSNATVDSILEELRSTRDDQGRSRLYRELQRRVSEDFPVIYTLYVPRLLAVGPRIRGVEAGRNGPFSSVSEWWIPAAQRRRGR